MAADDEDAPPPEAFYNKSKSFFDSISCEALERSKGNMNKPDWRAEKKLNKQTFGVTGGGGGGGFRRGGYGFRGGNRGGGWGRGGTRGGYGYRGGENKTFLYLHASIYRFQILGYGGGGGGYNNYNNNNGYGGGGRFSRDQRAGGGGGGRGGGGGGSNGRNF